MDGFVLVNKPVGVTSHDCISRLRKLLNTKKIGHSGTLDPFATGVLVCAVGQATRCLQYLPNSNKTYIATIKFGQLTDTLDLTGKIVEEDEEIKNKFPNKEKILEVLNNFLGESEQIPPMFSAIKVNGKKMYDLARKGESIELEPRKINIFDIKLIEISEPDYSIKIEVECSAGTYIRSLARDIGEKFDTYGHLISLERSKAGNHDIKNSIDIFNDQKSCEIGSIKEFLDGILTIELPLEECIKLQHGQMVELTKDYSLKPGDKEIALVVNDSSCIAIVEIHSGIDSKSLLKPVRVFLDGVK